MHEKRIHEKVRPLIYVCEKFKKVCKNQTGSTTHLNVCGKPKVKETFQCEICLVSLKQKSSLEGHMQTHSIFRPTYSCTICGAQLLTSVSLRKHQLTHEGNRPRPFQCDICSARYKEKRNLINHVERVHK